MNEKKLIAYLRRNNLISSQRVRVTPLSGGVSSDILLIEDGDRRFVLKRALGRLRVKDEWRADVSRNHYEQAYMRYAGRILPQHVPGILHSDRRMGFFTMPYLSGAWSNWKQDLLCGRIQADCARLAGRFLGTVHSASWGDAELKAHFDNTDLFYQLRIEPYLLTTGRRTPELRPLFEAEADRLAATRLALVHGDFSPKNLLVRAGGLMVLDCEVAWFGDPAFDVGFLLNHLFLKSIHLPEQHLSYLKLVDVFLARYRAHMARVFDAEFEQRVSRLLLMLMLARIVGKSPAEYLMDDSRKVEFIKAFVHRSLATGPLRIDSVQADWADRIQDIQ